ncbi:hypothetical protein JIG36_50810 [Actinoplanes sp. LDG1-06]|uniref:Uncharacterized protein n=1 Tax=Paractinoplanes ovalisporus TaxID=2810368 RepID=A0ABS2AVD0_9ACTN|nr:hypothetical protein [Actinoplanes ovalisporus]MBM2623810.1 hypothetical protein [Actinoplanes ovalisporus]
MDPQRFIAAARRAYLAANPTATPQQVEQDVADVRDAAYALIDRYGSLAPDHPAVATRNGSRPDMHGGAGLLPGDYDTDRPDGLSPAGSLRVLDLDTATLQSFGCAPSRYRRWF